MGRTVFADDDDDRDDQDPAEQGVNGNRDMPAWTDDSKEWPPQEPDEAANQSQR